MSICHTFNKAIIEKTGEACRLNVILIGRYSKKPGSHDWQKIDDNIHAAGFNILKMKT